MSWQEQYEAMKEYAVQRDQEIERLRGIISTSRDPDGPPNRWLGKCGHEWRKDQSIDCPICDREKLFDALSWIEDQEPQIVAWAKDKFQLPQNPYSEVKERPQTWTRR